MLKLPDFQFRTFGTTFSSLKENLSVMKQKGATKKKGTKTLKDRIHQHLNDKNDIITDEDMKNIKVGEETAEEEPETKQELKDADKLADAIEEKKQSTPWTILGEEDN